MTGPDQGRLLWVNGDRDPSHAYRVHNPSIEADIERCLSDGSVLVEPLDGGRMLFLNCRLVTQIVLSERPPDSTQVIH